MHDEVMEELWRVKDAIAEKHNYDFRLLANTLKKYENWEAPAWDRPPVKLASSFRVNEGKPDVDYKP
jgi:hypothetical protein